ncbi:MAG TPA: 6,7-dimethyl-8-ribityllumazine synthase [Ignavibacteria bacterium]|nr:6,7-dimethyl-8-ribityllumazine synthase [Ignavibacteria bacterium]HMQ99661.1 6,7-dimethyl-8-ribityllumazine synthase [Ignavibacteria bacterium]
MAKEKKKSSGKSQKKVSGRIAVVVSRFNEEVTGGLLQGALSILRENKYADKNVTVIHVPGAYEIPLTAKHLCMSGKYCGVICLGAVIKGETAHFEYISNAVSNGIMSLNLEYSMPVSFGVLTCYTDEQALKRSQNDEHNKGREAASAVLDMIRILKEI